MNQGLDHKKLSEAAKALERAADAAFRSQQWPHMTNYVCKAQHSAAVAEVAAWHRLDAKCIRALAPAAPVPEPVALVSGFNHEVRKDLLWVNGFDQSTLDDGTMLYAAPVATSPEAKPAPEVKALEWEGHRAQTEFGSYAVMDHVGYGPAPSERYSLDKPGSVTAYHFDRNRIEARFATPEAAKAAAQSDYNRRVRACLVDGGWRPIEEAPKDGTELLLACVGWPPAVAASKPVPRKVGGWDTFSKSWMIFGASWEPTHWQPLPPGPTATGVE